MLAVKRTVNTGTDKYGRQKYGIRKYFECPRCKNRIRRGG